jgi:hypothetical protein
MEEREYVAVERASSSAEQIGELSSGYGAGKVSHVDE